MSLYLIYSILRIHESTVCYNTKVTGKFNIGEANNISNFTEVVAQIYYKTKLKTTKYLQYYLYKGELA